jgi:signal transduction histidine kinase
MPGGALRPEGSDRLLPEKETVTSARRLRADVAGDRLRRMETPLSRRQRAADAGLGLLFATSGQIQLFVPNDDGYFGGPAWLNVLVMVATSLPLAARRTHPVAVVAAVFGVHVAVNLVTAHTVTFWGTIVPLGIALYSCARYGPAPARRALPVLALPAVFTLTYGLHVPGFGRWDDYFFTALMWGSAWGAGRVINLLQQQRRALRVALEQLEEQGERRRRQVLLEERTRIARDMHDVVAHGVSVMVVQTGAARLELHEDDDVARTHLLAVEQAGRAVLDELRRTVHLLRSGDEPADGRPAPGLTDIPALVEAMRTAGLDIELTMDAVDTEDQGRGLTAYRVVQEALTNALRHAGRTSVRVRVTGAPYLRVEVSDDGAAAPGRAAATGGAGATGGGHGLVGMRERVEMYGGRLHVEEHEPGFLVRAEIPAVQA